MAVEQASACPLGCGGLGTGLLESFLADASRYRCRADAGPPATPWRIVCALSNLKPSTDFEVVVVDNSGTGRCADSGGPRARDRELSQRGIRRGGQSGDARLARRPIWLR